MTRGARALALVAVAVCCSAARAATAEESTCFGTSAAGALRGGVKLPRSGENFAAYHAAGWLAGRTYVHSRVHAAVLGAYQTLERRVPDQMFLYGETGFARGGPFRPHRTHQNGLSVDFMVPVRDGAGRAMPLPTSLFNKLGYSLEFDEAGRLGDLAIDFDAIAEHLRALRDAAAHEGIAVRRVIFDPDLQPALRQSEAWAGIAALRFSTRRSWVRHDEHYHVDFRVPCEVLSAVEDR